MLPPFALFPLLNFRLVFVPTHTTEVELMKRFALDRRIGASQTLEIVRSSGGRPTYHAAAVSTGQLTQGAIVGSLLFNGCPLLADRRPTIWMQSTIRSGDRPPA